MGAREEAIQSLEQTNKEIEKERKKLDKQDKERIRALAKAYPSIASKLWVHYRRMKAITLDCLLSFDEWVLACSQEYWTYLTLLQSVEPDFPIVAMHDKFKAELEAMQRDTIDQMIAIETAFQEHRNDMRDLAFAYQTSDQDEIDRIDTKYQTDEGR